MSKEGLTTKYQRDIYVLNIHSTDCGIDLDGYYVHQEEVSKDVHRTVELLINRIDELEEIIARGGR